MNCRKFESQLELYLAEKLSYDSVQECRIHLNSCAACRELLDLASKAPLKIDPAGSEELIRAVLEKTSGKNCDKVLELLPDRVDGSMAKDSADLVDRHLENCGSCQNLFRTMKELKEVLPSFSQMDPGSAFTRECMQAIGRLQNRPPQPGFSSGGIWHWLLVRPRLAWQSAYVLTLLFFIFIKVFAIIPGLNFAEAADDLHSRSARFGVSMASTLKVNSGGWTAALTDQQDRWANAASRGKEELLSSILLMTDKTREFSQSASSIIIRLPHSTWNGIADKWEKIRPKYRSAT
jgi:predicted anti-sigma-YlaC factor YlaD